MTATPKAPANSLAAARARMVAAYEEVRALGTWYAPRVVELEDATAEYRRAYALTLTPAAGRAGFLLTGARDCETRDGQALEMTTCLYILTQRR